MKHGFLLALALCCVCTSRALAGDARARIRVTESPEANPWTSLELKNNPEAFQFAIVSDRTGGHRPGVFEDAVRKLNLLQPEFVMSVGDLIEGYSESEEDLLGQWKQFDGFVHKLEMPFFYVVGNHDISNPVMERVWQSHLGPTYYHFVYRDVLFLCLNTEDPPDTHIGDAQIAYAEETLAANPDVRWTLVFMHKPLWDYTGDTGWAKIEALLQNRPHSVFAGHRHTYAKSVKNNQSYIMLATTGGGSEMRGPLYGQFDHVVWVTMTEQGPRVANLMLDGIWDENIRTDEIAALVEPLIRGTAVSLAHRMEPAANFDGGPGQLRLTNDADYPMWVEVAFRSREGVAFEPAKVQKTLNPNSVELIDVSVAVDQPLPILSLDPLLADWKVAYDLPERPRIEMSGVERLVVDTAYAIAASPVPIEMDGALEEWKDLPYVCREAGQLLADVETWSGPEDLSFRFGAAYDATAVYVAVEVTDDQQVHRSNPRPWAQDDIELYIDARPLEAAGPVTGDQEFTEYLRLAFAPGEPLIAHRQDLWPEGAKVAWQKTATGYTAEFAVPRTFLDAAQGKPWENFRLNLSVYDYDAQGRVKFLWRPDWSGPKFAREAGYFIKK